MQFEAGPIGTALRRKYDIRFMYDTMPDGTVKTTCTISYVDPKIERGPEKYHEISRGVSIWNGKDQWDKNVGRHYALTRAIQTFPKASRKAAWEAYLNRRQNNTGPDPEWYRH